MTHAGNLSPVTRSANTSEVGSVEVRWLEEQYRRELKLDISRFTGSLKKIAIRQCDDTGYRYYEPASAAGDASFYQELEVFPWYYMDWKWEHAAAMGYILPGMQVLEIGCGRGGFLERLPNVRVGLELNEHAVVEARRKGLDVRAESVAAHASTHAGGYDVVCSFQVLEHVVDVHEFVLSSVAALRPGGLLLVSVPNNDAFIFKEFQPILNFPPHHMGLWTANALLGLQRIADIQAAAVLLEPLQPYHLGYGTDFLARKLAARRSKVVAGAAAKIDRLVFGELPPLQVLAEASASAFAPYLPGHSVLVVFRKSEK